MNHIGLFFVFLFGIEYIRSIFSTGKFYRRGWIGFRIDGFGLKKRMDCGFVRQIERIRGFWKHCGSWISCNFFPDCACLLFGLWALNEIWITDLSSALIGTLISSPNYFFFPKEVHLNPGVRLLLDLYCVVVIKHVAFLTIWAKLTVALTCTSLPLNLYISVFGCGCGFGFE